jgi:MFS family permease
MSENRAENLLVRLALANVGFAQALYVGLLLIVPDRAAAIGGHGGKTVLLAAVAGAGAVVALLAGLAAGWVSDRRLRSAGRRGPVLVVSASVGGVLMAVLPFTHSRAALLLVWCGAQAGLNGVYTVVTTALLDWFTVAQRGRASAFAAYGQVAGVLLASGLVFTIGSYPWAIGLASGAMLLLTALPMWRRRFRGSIRCAAEPVPPKPQRDYRDVRLAWGVRGVVTFANTLVITFANYYVTDALHLHDPQRFLGVAAGVIAVLVLTGAGYSGRASDRSGRRKRYVVAAVAIMCVGELVLACWQRVPGVLAACALFGFGYGIYLSIDQALTADVLPDRLAYGRDVGIMNAATSATQVAAPLVAALLLAGTSSYDLLFAFGALITLGGAALIIPIRAVC